MKKKESDQMDRDSSAHVYHQKTHLSCHAPDAQSVFVAGTFNDWKSDAAPLHRHSDGDWDLKLALAPGRYEYKFVVDGQWCCKPGSDHEGRDDPHCCANDFGTMNRVLEV